MSRPLPRYRDDTDPLKVERAVTRKPSARAQAAEAKAKRRAERQALRDLRSATIRGATQGEPVYRNDIIDRDLRTCHLCGKTHLEDHEIHLDHVIPLSKGGTHTADNVKVACAPCNLRKGARIL